MEEEFKICSSKYRDFQFPEEFNYVTIEETNKNINKYQLLQEIKGLEEALELSIQKRKQD